MTRGMSNGLLAAALAALLFLAGAPAASAAPEDLDVTVENKYGASWSFDQAPVRIGSWATTPPGLIGAEGSASFSAAPSPEALFAGTAVYMLDATGPITQAAIYVSAIGEVRAVRCLPLENLEVPDCTYRREGQDFFVGLYDPASAPGPQATLSLPPAPAPSDVLSGGLPLGLESTKPGHATVSLRSGGRVAAQAQIDPVLPAYPHRISLRLRPWSRKALRHGNLDRLALRVHLVDTTGHHRSYRRAVHIAPR